MDKKALAAIIVLLSALVVLLLINFNQKAMAPAISPLPSAAAVPVKPPAAMVDIADAMASGNVTGNETATPTPLPTLETKQTPSRSDSKPAGKASPSPSAMAAWKAMPAWSPMPKASPISNSQVLVKNKTAK